MVKPFTKDDIDEVKTVRRGTGIDTEILCEIKFKGCSNFVQFYANKNGRNEFSRNMWTSLNAEEYGEPTFPPSEYRTLPKEQEELEEEVIAKRNQLLVESDWTDSAGGQARLSSEEQTAWATYRQALRDITDQVGYPFDPEWPVKP
jgi:hypothetical protein